MGDSVVLYVVATPIGNVGDLSVRARQILTEADVLACEDTRVTRKLFEKCELVWPPTVFSYHEHNEERAGETVLRAVREGKRVVLCSDGGCPTISDPGYRVINAALEEGLEVVAIPGPCAIETALMASGMPTSSFTFLGFPPPKSGKRQNWFAAEAERPHTLVMYESPHRISKTLADAATVLGPRKAAVCRELTKLHETVERGWLDELAEAYIGRSVKGEIVLIIAGNNAKFIRADSEK